MAMDPSAIQSSPSSPSFHHDTPDAAEVSEIQSHEQDSDARYDVPLDDTPTAIPAGYETNHPPLPMGASAPPTQTQLVASNATLASSTPSTHDSPSTFPPAASSSSSSSSSSTAVPAVVARSMQISQLSRVPEPLLPEYQSWGERKAVGLGRLVWVGLKAFAALEFVGEVFADFLGLYDSKYQYVVDAYERNKRELAIERAERAAARREAREAQLARAAEEEEQRNQTMEARLEQNRQEQRREEDEKQQGEQAPATAMPSQSDNV